MLKTIIGDITSVEVDAIVNASNSIGIMGAGVAGAIKTVGGIEIQEEAKRKCKKNKFNEGCCFSTTSGKLLDCGIKKIYHAITMKYPGGFTSIHFIRDATRAVFHMSIKDKMKSIAFPGLGTGIGRLDKTSVARTMFDIAIRFNGIIDIFFVDLDVEFVSEIDKLIGGETDVDFK